MHQLNVVQLNFPMGWNHTRYVPCRPLCSEPNRGGVKSSVSRSTMPIGVRWLMCSWWTDRRRTAGRRRGPHGGLMVSAPAEWCRHRSQSPPGIRLPGSNLDREQDKGISFNHTTTSMGNHRCSLVCDHTVWPIEESMNQQKNLTNIMTMLNQKKPKVWWFPFPLQQRY